jgi:signal peptidase I
MNTFKNVLEKFKALKTRYGMAYDFITSIIISYILVLLLTSFIVYPIHVDGSSMYPTLSDLDYGFSNLLTYRSEGLERFDVVIIYYAPIDEYLIKRVVGLPGDTVEVKNDILYINGTETDQPFLDSSYRDQWVATGEPYTANFGPILVKANEVFVMGDNRRVGGSTDSRVFGCLPIDNIRSKDVYIFWPLSHFRWLTGQ